MSDCEWEKLSLRRRVETLGVADLAHNLLDLCPHATRDSSLWVFQVTHRPRENLSSKIMRDVYK